MLYIYLYMEIWLVFWNCLFWLVFFIFFLNSNNFISLLLYSEIVWILLYIITLLYGNINDDINLYSISFFFLALAGLEFSFGLLIIILFKTVKYNFDFSLNDNQVNQFFKKNTKKLRINKYVWSNIS